MRRKFAFAAVTGLAFLGLAGAFVYPASTEAISVAAQSEETDWDELAATLSKQPVDARLDRVWKAVPGLKGWRLNIPASKQATATANDEKLHLRFEHIDPQVSLSTFASHPIYRGPDAEKSVCLMFNVSWGEAYVPGLLKDLAKEHVRATFFIDGKWAAAHPDLTRQIVKDGQCIGSHGSGHKDFRKLSDAALRTQVEQTNDVIVSVAGVKPRAIAPPAGSYDERAVKAAEAGGMYTILWTVDTIDWRRPPKDAIVGRVARLVEPGALILMHPTEPTLAALPELIDMLKDRGYRFKTINQLIDEVPAAEPPDTLSAKS